MDRPKILVVRCSRLPHFRRALERIQQEHPECEIHVLAKRSLVAECSALPGVQRVVPHPDQPFSLLKTMLRISPRIRRHIYTLVVLPVSTGTRVEYLNVELATLPLRFARVATFTPDGRWVERDKNQFLRQDIVKDLLLFLAEWADVPLLFLLLFAAHFMRPLRWLKERVSRITGTAFVPRKVMHCIPSLGMGGAQRQMIKVIEALAPRYEVSLCVLTDCDFFFGENFEKAGVKSHVLNHGSRAYALSALRLCWLLRSERVDVLHTWLPMANVVGALAGFLAGTPRIVTSERCLTSSKQTWYPQRWFRWADALAVRLSDVVSVNAYAVLDDYIRWTWLRRKSVVVVHNGSEDDEFEYLDENGKQQLRTELGLSAGDRVVGIFGRLEAEKDHGSFLRAVQCETRRMQNVRVLIVGGGSLETQLSDVAHELGISDRVQFLGSRPDATSLMQLCDVVALSSVTEGMPNVLLEAQHLGIPVVTTDAGGCREIVRHAETGFVVPVGNHIALANHLDILLTNPDIARSFGEAGRRRIRKEFTVAGTVSGFEALYWGKPVEPANLNPLLSKEGWLRH